MHTVLFELCVESVDAALAGERGGADRIELCSELACGGVTPDGNLMSSTIHALSIPAHILIRPRSGSFVYSESEFDRMRRQVEEAREAGAAGVALGMLLADGTVDVNRSCELVKLARPMEVTFHRAFDEARNLREALESVIETGAGSLLTSGGAVDVLSGARCIADLRRQAGERINIIARGGLRLENLAETVRRSGVFSLHGSLNRRKGQLAPEESVKALEADVRQAISLLREVDRELSAVSSVA